MFNVRQLPQGSNDCYSERTSATNLRGFLSVISVFSVVRGVSIVVALNLGENSRKQEDHGTTENTEITENGSGFTRSQFSPARTGHLRYSLASGDFVGPRLFEHLL